MIVYDLSCDSGHKFEGWFGSSDDYAKQHDAGLLSCPQCGSQAVTKAPMAVAVPKKGNQQQSLPASAPVDGGKQDMASGPMTPEISEALLKLAQAQAKALENSTWVGDSFAEQSRAMHYGERDAEAIHGQASAEEAKSLLEEGVAVAPLPFPITPPEDLN